ncbi:AIR carboxylase family protein [Halobacteriovorax sp.]|uniref:AIR carboxylase family protein n=1 Tax=Halobacteriovorax sp. TaxID=2020862 RepID=UPI0035685998
MRSVLVLFGSESDEYIYTDILEYLKPNFKVNFKVLSVHRDSSKILELLKEDDFDFVLAGAGLGAALPGFCAAHTEKPVFGIPVPNCFGGLDAFLSIIQMPFEVPVGALSPKSISSLSSLLDEVDSKKSRVVNIVLSPDIENHEYANQEYSLLADYALTLGIEIKRSSSVDEELMNIILVHTDDSHKVSNNALYVPLLTKSEKNSPAFSIRLLNLIDYGGVWFGVNSPRNALKFLNKLL